MDAPDGKVIPEIGLRQLDAILRFLPLFEGPAVQFGSWVRREGQFPFVAYGHEVNEFVRALYDQDILLEFDWSSWREKARRYVDDAKALAGADLLTLRKLLTLHVRTDRFVEGHLLVVLESGHITAILRRLERLRDEMG